MNAVSHHHGINKGGMRLINHAPRRLRDGASPTRYGKEEKESSKKEEEVTSFL